MKRNLLKLMLAAGALCSTQVTNAQTAWSWGYNLHGELGQGTSGSGFSTTQPGMVDSTNDWKVIDAAGNTTLGLKTDSTLWGWGSNTNGQLGAATTGSPAQIGTDKWVAISEGEYHAVALKADGTVWTWGSNSFGTLGNGTTGGNNVPTPTQMGTDNNWASIAAGQWFTIAIKTDGTLWYWGHSNVGNVLSQPTPMQVGTSTDWSFIATGWNSHSIAIKTDGTMWAWGLNDKGQIGQGTTSFPIDTLTKIGTDNTWKSASVGHGYTLALKTDGTLWAWGWNDRGQLGDATAVDKYIPTQVGTDTDWKFATAGRKHSAAIKNDGSLWTWGWNNNSQLGDGATADKNAPTRLGTATDWEYVSSDELYTTALRKAATNGVQKIAVNQNSINVYPNPATTRITFIGKNIKTITLLDMSGKTLLQSNNTSVDIAALPAGLLVYKATLIDGTVQTGLISKN